MVDVRLNLPQRVILAICVPVLVTVAVLFLEIKLSGSGFQRAGRYWIARELWWVWTLAIVAVTTFELFLWRKRCKLGGE